MKRTILMALMTTSLISGVVYADDRLPVWTGGIGSAEREQVEQTQAEYTLKLVFTGEGGMYVSRVQVRITDKDGAEVVNTTTQGPYLLADLEPGKYVVETNAEGTTKKFNVTLGNHLKTQQVRFPIKDDSTL